jgi:hypothetical protein
LAAIAAAGSDFGDADGGSDSPEAEANNTKTNDTLAKLHTKAKAAQATLALDEIGSSFTDCMTFSFRTHGSTMEGTSAAAHSPCEKSRPHAGGMAAMIRPEC